MAVPGSRLYAPEHLRVDGNSEVVPPRLHEDEEDYEESGDYRDQEGDLEGYDEEGYDEHDEDEVHDDDELFDYEDRLMGTRAPVNATPHAATKGFQMHSLPQFEKKVNLGRIDDVLNSLPSHASSEAKEQIKRDMVRCSLATRMRRGSAQHWREGNTRIHLRSRSKVVTWIARIAPPRSKCWTRARG